MPTNGLRVDTDASASGAADGATLNSYEWDWGDGSATDFGVTATHTYAAAGNYTVQLTVKDSLGSTGTTTKQAQVPATNVKALDLFERNVATGWGSADVGGAWTGTTGFSVSGGVGARVGPLHGHSQYDIAGVGRRLDNDLHYRC